MAFTYERQVGTGSASDSTSIKDVAVGAAGIPIGALVVVVMTKSIAMTPSVTDSKGNTYTVHEQRNEPLDSQEVAIASCVLTTALVNGDNVSPTFGGTFSQKTWQVHEFRSDGTITFEQATGAASSFPHSAQNAGTLTNTTGDLVVAGFVQNTTSAVTWTPGTGFTALAALDPGDTVAYAQYDLSGAGGSHAVSADSNVDAANAGVCACWSDGSPQPPSISHDAVSRSEAGETGSYTGTGSPGRTWTHTPVGTPKGVVVAITQPLLAADQVTSVTYGGVAMTRVVSVARTSTEAMRVYLYFLGAGIPTGAQTVELIASGNSHKHGFCFTMTTSNGADTTVDSSNSSDLGIIANPSLTVTHTGTLTGWAGYAVHGYGGAAPVSTGLQTGETYQLGHDPGAAVGMTYTRHGGADAASSTYGYTTLASDDQLIAAAVIKPVAAASPVFPRRPHRGLYMRRRT